MGDIEEKDSPLALCIWKPFV